MYFTCISCLCILTCFDHIPLNREEDHKLRWFIGLKLKKGMLGRMLLLLTCLLVVGEKSLDLTYEIQAFTDAGIFINLNCTTSQFSLNYFLCILVLNSPAVVNSPELADGQLVEVIYVKRYC